MGDCYEEAFAIETHGLGDFSVEALVVWTLRLDKWRPGLGGNSAGFLCGEFAADVVWCVRKVEKIRRKEQLAGKVKVHATAGFRRFFEVSYLEGRGK